VAEPILPVGSYLFCRLPGLPLLIAAPLVLVSGLLALAGTVVLLARIVLLVGIMLLAGVVLARALLITLTRPGLLPLIRLLRLVLAPLGLP